MNRIKKLSWNNMGYGSSLSPKRRGPMCHSNRNYNLQLYTKTTQVVACNYTSPTKIYFPSHFCPSMKLRLENACACLAEST